ncbi:hypothetical protein PRZ48_005350 [Zasmidium cellare]|uniref:Fe2OG dioxygenase domain-containing protein n=1 Tax=Zasmidium cellare TaxID=395010 RepID=A0ABR0ESS0_ZASCE|nr:hypothetical protein PRZ48_005350 [Zasmidium cellare]
MATVSKAALPLSLIDLDRLVAGNVDERKRLVAACRDQGFFYLSLTSDPQLLADWENVLDFMKTYFAKSQQEKMEDSFKSDTHGDALRHDHNLMCDSAVEQHELLNRFVESADRAVGVILRELDIGVSRESSSSFQASHGAGDPSLTTLAMFRYPRQDTLDVGLGHNMHTDLGTLTFLLCQTPGLQVLSNDPPGWHHVAPRPGCAIINVGDTLRYLSGNSLRSAVHRVMPVNQLQEEDRYSIAYFLRAADNIKFIDSMGRSTTAKQWHDEKFDVFRESHEDQAKRPILTGGVESNGALVF